MAVPSWLKEAIPTLLGWAHPLTGEQLTGRISDEDAQDAGSFYIPNAHAKSFLDPAGSTRQVLHYIEVNGRATFRVLSLDPIVSVDWDFGDGTSQAGGNAWARHSFADGTHPVEATVTFLDDEGEEDVIVLNLSITVDTGNPVEAEIVAPEFVIVKVGGTVGDETEVPVGSAIFAMYNLGMGFNETGLSLVYKWLLDDVEIAGQSGGTYTPVVEDIGGVVTVEITATNSEGTDTMVSSNSITVIAAE